MAKTHGTLNPSKRGNTVCSILLIIVLASYVLFAAVGIGNASSLKANEIEAVEKAVREYFDAEVRTDFRAVYRMLAPSSDYARTHTYEDYLVEAKSSEVRVTTYRILRIDGLRENHDREKYPDIEAFARVEVEVQVFYKDRGSYETMNLHFTFVKEGNRWFKG